MYVHRILVQKCLPHTGYIGWVQRGTSQTTMPVSVRACYQIRWGPTWSGSNSTNEDHHHEQRKIIRSGLRRSFVPPNASHLKLSDPCAHEPPRSGSNHLNQYATTVRDCRTSPFPSPSVLFGGENLSGPGSSWKHGSLICHCCRVECTVLRSVLRWYGVVFWIFFARCYHIHTTIVVVGFG
jgi:hypothetical protein